MNLIVVEVRSVCALLTQDTASSSSDKSNRSDRSELLDPHGIADATPEVAANTLLCLINQAIYLLKRQIEKLEQDFVGEEVEWALVSTSEALSLRKGEGGLLLNRVLEDKVIELNTGLIAADNVDEAIRRIEAVRNTIQGNAEILGWLRGEQSIYDHDEKRERNVTVVDFAKADHNDFHVTDEWQYTNCCTCGCRIMGNFSEV